MVRGTIVLTAVVLIFAGEMLYGTGEAEFYEWNVGERRFVGSAMFVIGLLLLSVVAFV